MKIKRIYAFGPEDAPEDWFNHVLWLWSMVSTDWFHTCWSSSRLLLEEGSKMGPGCVFFELKCLYNGWSDEVFPPEMRLPWRGGAKGSFAFDDFESAVSLVKKLFPAAPSPL